MQDAAVDVSVYLLPETPTSNSPALLTAPERRRVAALTREPDRRAFVAAHTLLRLALADHLAAATRAPTPSELAFDFACARCGEQHGPPRILAGPGAGTAISLTRSSGFVAVVVLHPRLAVSAASAPASAPVPGTRGFRVGIDIERLDAVAFDGFDDVALTPAERVRLADAPTAGASAFPLCTASGVPGVEPGLAARGALWARKEAVAKALGSGLRRDPREIEVLASAASASGDIASDAFGSDASASGEAASNPSLTGASASGEAASDASGTDGFAPDSSASGHTVVDGQRVAWRDVFVDHGGFAAAVAVSGVAPGTSIRVALHDAAPLFARLAATAPDH